MKRARINLTITATYEKQDDSDLTSEELTTLRDNLAAIAQQASLEGRYTDGADEVYLDNLDYHVELAKEVS